MNERAPYTFADQYIFHDQPHKRIAVVVTGGTLMAEEDQDTGARPKISGEELLELCELGSLRERVTLDIHKVYREDESKVFKDSGAMTHRDWTPCVEKHAELLRDNQATLHVMGTDTAEFVGPALTFGLQGRAAIDGLPSYLASPILIVTSQAKPRDILTDSKDQIRRGVMTLIEASRERISEVMVLSGTDIFRASRAIKFSTENLGDIYKSLTYHEIGEIGTDGVAFSRYAERIPYSSDLLHLSALPPVQSDFKGGIISIGLNCLSTIGPWITAVEHEECTAVEIEGFGAGTAPVNEFSGDKEYAITPVVKRAIELGKPVIFTSRVPKAKVNLHKYEPGRVLEGIGVIGSSNMTRAAAIVKLSWLMALPEFERGYTDRLGQRHKGIDFIRHMFLRNLVGERREPENGEMDFTVLAGAC